MTVHYVSIKICRNTSSLSVFRGNWYVSRHWYVLRRYRRMPNFIYVQLWSFQILLASWNVLCAKSMFSLLVCLALKFTDIVLYSILRWCILKFNDKLNNSWLLRNEPYLLNLKEQIDHLWSIDIIYSLKRIPSLKVAQSLFKVLAVYQTYLENDKSIFDETNDILKLI